jgi:hypothetical protein
MTTMTTRKGYGKSYTMQNLMPITGSMGSAIFHSMGDGEYL